MIQIHTIPVPPKMTPEDAWMEIVVYGRLKLPWWRRWFMQMGWVNIRVDPDRPTEFEVF